jgi:hypothetical protein
VPIGKGDPFWRTYMGRHRQNLEHRYHNGGIWPFVGGFWVLALAAAGRGPQAAQELVRLARANALHDWQFNEWFHGQSGEAEGMPGQTWNAAMFLLARHGLATSVFRRVYDMATRKAALAQAKARVAPNSGWHCRPDGMRLAEFVAGRRK